MSSLQLPLLPPYKPPPPPPSPQQPTMAQDGRWETFDDDDDEESEALSLCDLPIKSLPTKEERYYYKSTDAVEDFEFRTLGAGLILSKTDMCAADEVFFKGQILPLRPSVCGSLSDSMGRSISSSSRSSGCISRSHSSNSFSSINCDAPARVSISNNFYAHPSPSPQVRRERRGSNAARSSTGSAPAGWAFFRLGVVKAPEIELNGLRTRPIVGSGSGRASKKVEKKVGPRFLGRGFGCKCVVETVEIVPSSVLIAKKKKGGGGGGLGLERKESMCQRSRMFEWLEELSLGKGSVD